MLLALPSYSCRMLRLTGSATLAAAAPRHKMHFPPLWGMDIRALARKAASQKDLKSRTFRSQTASTEVLPPSEMGNSLCCYTCVDQSSVQVIEQFGKFNRVAFPGFNCVWCCMGESVAGGLSLRIQQLDVRCETKTKDNVFVDVVVSVQYQVVRENLYDAFYKLTDSRSQITSYVFDIVRSTVPKMILDDVFLSKEEIAHEVKEELTKSMSAFGFQIIKTLVTDIEPAAKVKAAMNEINAAQRLRQAAYEQSEADKIRIVKAAEADAEAKYLAGQGIARQRQAIISGLRESVQAFRDEVTDVNSRDVMELLLITQYFDTLKDVGTNGRASTIFLPHSPGAVGDVSAQLRNGFLAAMSAQEQQLMHR